MHKVLIAISRKKEKDLIMEWLGDNWNVGSISEPREILSMALDLCLLDRKKFTQIRPYIKKRKEIETNAAPCFIVVIPRKRIGEIGRDIDRLIDDILYTPLDKTEFDFRLGCQLRMKAIRLARQERKERVGNFPEKDHAPDRPLRILAVDDYELNHKLFELQLKNHDVTIVDRGAKALEKLEARNFDIVLMDIQMPEMDGYQTAKKIRDPSSGVLDPDIPIIAMSAHDGASELRLAAESGMNGFAKKPLKKDMLLTEIGKILARKNNSSPVAAATGEKFPGADRKNRNKKISIVSPREPQPEADQVDGRSRCMMDLKATFELMGGKESIVKKVCDALIADLPKKIESLRHSVESENLVETRRISHDLKSGARCVCAENAADLSCELEIASMAGDKDRIREMLPMVQNVFNALYRELRAYRNA